MSQLIYHCVTHVAHIEYYNYSQFCCISYLECHYFWSYCSQLLYFILESMPVIINVSQGGVDGWVNR